MSPRALKSSPGARSNASFPPVGAKSAQGCPTFAPAEAVDRFGGVLRDSLRRSDSYAKSGKGQYMVLLPEPGEDNGEAILKRIADSWAEDELGKSVPVTCEHEPVVPVA